MKTRIRIAAAAISLVLTAGCGGKKAKEITELDRKQAALAASDAGFAVTMRDWAGAERAFAKATELSPDTGTYWVSLGTVRMRLGQRDAARKAYEQGLAAFVAEAEKSGASPEPWLQQIYVQALLGRVEAARALQGKVSARFSDHPAVKSFVNGKQLERMLADPDFKQIAL